MPTNHPLVIAAAALAREVHGAQPYGQGLHIDHCMRVVDQLQRHGFSRPTLLAGGWLHDGYEDTPLDRARLVAILDAANTEGPAAGEHVHRLVWTCSGEGARRRDRVASILAKLRQDREALPIKVSDRIDNVEQSWLQGDSRLFMYYREYPDFRSLRNDSLEPTLVPMWERLDKMLGWWDPRIQRALSRV